MTQKTAIIKTFLQSVTEVYYKERQVLQSVTDYYYKMRQVLESVIVFIASYYKVRRNTSSKDYFFSHVSPCLTL